MAGTSSEFASAAVLVDSAFEMLIDAASILKDAGDLAGHKNLYDLANQVSKEVESIRDRQLGRASAPANENEDQAGS